MWRPSSTSTSSRPSGCPRGSPTSLQPDHASSTMAARPGDIVAARPPPLHVALELLERAISYTRSSLQQVSAGDLQVETPCSEWDLAALLQHMDDSLRALQDAADTGRVVVVPSEPDDPTDPVASLKDH